MILANPQPLLEESFEKRLFTRRDDLSNTIRLTIANNALYAMLNGGWGTITNLANEYDISRTFIYSLAKTLNSILKFLIFLFVDFSNSP